MNRDEKDRARREPRSCSSLFDYTGRVKGDGRSLLRLREINLSGSSYSFPSYATATERPFAHRVVHVGRVRGDA